MVTETLLKRFLASLNIIMNTDDIPSSSYLGGSRDQTVTLQHPPDLSSTQLASKTGLSSAEICREGSHCQAQIKYWWLYKYGVEKDSKAQEDAFMHGIGKDSGDKEHAVFNNRAE